MRSTDRIGLGAAMVGVLICCGVLLADREEGRRNRREGGGFSQMPPAAARQVSFLNDVKPILDERCASCHADGEHKGHFRMDTRELFLRGGEEKPAVVVGNSARSRLVRMITRSGEDAMPPKGSRLTDEQIGILRAWIDQGLKWEQAPKAGPAAKFAQTAKEMPAAASRQVSFAKDVKPILDARCSDCHADGTSKGGFSLDTRKDLLQGGKGGAAVVVGKSADSLLVKMVAHAGVAPDKVMPPKGKPLTPEQVAILRAWIDQGAEWK